MRKLEHVLQSQDWNRQGIYELFAQADSLRSVWKKSGDNSLQGCFVIGLFYQPSTRTRASFSWAAEMLGIRQPFFSDNAGQFSSAVKGESLADTIRVHTRYSPDPKRLAIVLRHPEADAALEACLHSQGAHIINAGCGKRSGQHPTQALLDVYTIFKLQPDLFKPTIVMVGDLLNGRTVRSLSYLAIKLYEGLKLIFVSPPSLRMGDDIKSHLNEHNVDWLEETSIQGFLQAIEIADVIYMTRFQYEDLSPDDREQFPRYQSDFQLNEESLGRIKPQAIIMHPLPRNLELSRKIDADKRAVYLDDQIESGLLIRMALFKTLFV